MEENLVTRELKFFEKPQVRKALKIGGIVFVALLPILLFLLSLFVPVSRVNNVAIKLGINNIVRKYYVSDFYAKAFKFVNKNRLVCEKDGQKYFSGEYYMSEDNCFMCICDGRGNFKCVSNSSNGNSICLDQPGFIPLSSYGKSEKSGDSAFPTPFSASVSFEDPSTYTGTGIPDDIPEPTKLPFITPAPLLNLPQP